MIFALLCTEKLLLQKSFIFEDGPSGPHSMYVFLRKILNTAFDTLIKQFFFRNCVFNVLKVLKIILSLLLLYFIFFFTMFNKCTPSILVCKQKKKNTSFKEMDKVH
jgi:hypothetical protein